MGQINSLEQQGKTKGTPIARVRGLGSAHHGAHHWMMMHYTSAGSLLAGAYLAFSFLLLPDLAYGAVRAWAANPPVTFALGLMVVAFFWHTRLGLQVLIEDYVHTPGAKFATLLVMNFACFIGAALGLFYLAGIVVGAMAESAAGGVANALQASMQGGMGGMGR